jgi:hypothetical protein
MSNGYPFVSRRDILVRIGADPAFAIECVAILQDRYEHRATGGPSAGWMASHAAKATALAAKMALGEVTEKELVEAAKLAGRYSKQLARVFRERELAARPELGAQAAVFGVGGRVNAEAVPTTPPLPRTAEPPPAAKKRGRPKGSRNKPRQEPASKRRRARS